MSSLKKKVYDGIAWRSFVDFGNLIFLTIFTAILARLLSRADFGLVAMALLVNRFARSFTQIGFGTAVIQSQDLKEKQIAAVFYLQVGITLIASLIVYIGAPLAADFFNESQLTQIVRVLAWLIVLNGLSFPTVLLRKQLQFKGFSLLEMCAMIVGNIIGIVLAILGFGVWALVFRLLSQRLVYLIGIWLIAQWMPARPSFHGLGKTLRFGFNMLGSYLCKYFSQNLVAVFTGKFIGLETLGSFNIAYNLAVTPAMKIQSILTSVLTPFFSQIQKDISNFRDKFYSAIFSMSIFFIPLMMGVAAVAPNFVLTVYGEKWEEAGLFLTFLAFIGMFKGLEFLLDSVIISKGWTWIILRITIVEMLISIPLLYLGLFLFDMNGLVVAYLCASFIPLLLKVTASQKAVGDNALVYRATSLSFISSFFMFLVVFSSSILISATPLVELIVQIVVGITLYSIFRIKFINKKEREVIGKWPFSHVFSRI